MKAGRSVQAMECVVDVGLFQQQVEPLESFLPEVRLMDDMGEVLSPVANL